jgi:hypothetical protein
MCFDKNSIEPSLVLMAKHAANVWPELKSNQTLNVYFSLIATTPTPYSSTCFYSSFLSERLRDFISIK